MNSLDSVMHEQVKKILLTRITVGDKNDTIRFADDKEEIISGQKYYSDKDPDMSDFAIGFYEILYGKNPILKEDGTLNDVEFAGDTICSFDTTANRIPEANKSRKSRSNIEEWPLYLKEYYMKYHCLANFWLLPMEIGRTGKKFSKMSTSKDYIDRYLQYYKNNQNEYCRLYPNYFSQFNKFDDFINYHFFSGDDNFAAIISFSYDKKMDDVIFKMMKAMESRADAISKSEYCKLLWEYFKLYNLCSTNSEGNNGKIG